FFLVSGFLTEVTQQIHSLRASGVISSQAAKAAESEVRVFRKSSGTVCTVPLEIFLAIKLLYQNIADEATFYLPSFQERAIKRTLLPDKTASALLTLRCRAMSDFN